MKSTLGLTGTAPSHPDFLRTDFLIGSRSAGELTDYRRADETDAPETVSKCFPVETPWDCSSIANYRIEDGM